MKQTKVLFICVLAALLGAAAGVWFCGFLPGFDADAMLRILLGCVLAGSIAAVFLRGRQMAGPAWRAKPEPTGALAPVQRINFASVAANDEARESLNELADYLKNPEKYARMGARMPRGVLLYGPPGTGKTLLARALAGEANVPFFALSGSDFVQMYVGVGASRVRELFAKARRAGKSVIFIDEIDSMGKRRDERASEEREQTLNALLSEMSGFHPCDGVLVIAATNRIDTLDPALLRPGRFDRQIEVGLPGRDERLSILTLHSKNKPIDSSVDLSALAGATVRFSGASLESLLNEAAIRAARRGAALIERDDIDAAFLTQVAGADRRGGNMAPERRIVALHEAGHALATYLLLPEQRLTRVSILPTSKGAAGYSLSIPQESMVTIKSQLEKQIKVLLAGRAAEKLIAEEGELTAGASDDLKRASELTAAMVLDLGMEDSPGVSLRALSKACGGGTSEGFGLCKQVLDRHFESISHLLAENCDRLMRLTEALIEKEALSGEQVRALIEG